MVALLARGAVALVPSAKPTSRIPPVSIILPVLNEAAALPTALSKLQYLRNIGWQLILVDGGSTDTTVSVAQPMADKVVYSARGRALQMNAGADLASGEWLLFLHADTQLPETMKLFPPADSAAKFRQWGRFDVRLSGRKWLFRIIERMMSIRSRITGISTGDQAIFVRRDLFEAIGGYDEIPLMEDIDLCKRLKKVSPPYSLPERVVTSSRRWEENGVLATVLKMWWLRISFFFGVAPQVLAEKYYPEHFRTNRD